MLSEDPEELIAALPTRTKDDLFCLHFAQTSFGVKCLDLGIEAPSVSDMIIAATNAYRDLERFVVINPAQEAQWRAVLDKRRFHYRELLRLPVQSERGLPLMAVVLEGEF